MCEPTRCGALCATHAPKERAGRWYRSRLGLFASPLSASLSRLAFGRWCFLALPDGGRQGYAQAHALLPRARACSVALRFVIRPSAQLYSSQPSFCEPVPPSLLARRLFLTYPILLTLIHRVAFHRTMRGPNGISGQRQLHFGRFVRQPRAWNT